MKILYLTLISFLIIGCDIDHQVNKNNFINLSSFEFIHIDNFDKKMKKEHPLLLDIYKTEYMYLFLIKNYTERMSETEEPFSNFMKNIITQKTDDLKTIEGIFLHQKIKYENPTMEITGGFDFKDDKLNKLFNIFKGAKNKKEMYKNLCIGFNSIIYKYSEIINEDPHLYNKYLFKTMEEENIQKLLLINSTLKKINIDGCCELSGILCSSKKKINKK